MQGGFLALKVGVQSCAELFCFVGIPQIRLNQSLIACKRLCKLILRGARENAKNAFQNAGGFRPFGTFRGGVDLSLIQKTDMF